MIKKNQSHIASLFLPGLRFNDSFVLDASYQNWRIGGSRSLAFFVFLRAAAGAKVNESCTWAGNAYGARGTEAYSRSQNCYWACSPRGGVPSPSGVNERIFLCRDSRRPRVEFSFASPYRARLSLDPDSVPDAVSVEITIRCGRWM